MIWDDDKLSTLKSPNIMKRFVDELDFAQRDTQLLVMTLRTINDFNLYLERAQSLSEPEILSKYSDFGLFYKLKNDGYLTHKNAIVRLQIFQCIGVLIHLSNASHQLIEMDEMGIFEAWIQLACFCGSDEYTLFRRIASRLDIASDRILVFLLNHQIYLPFFGLWFDTLCIYTENTIYRQIGFSIRRMFERAQAENIERMMDDIVEIIAKYKQKNDVISEQKKYKILQLMWFIRTTFNREDFMRLLIILTPQFHLSYRYPSIILQADFSFSILQ